MGIQGLLVELKSSLQHVHITNLLRKESPKTGRFRVAIDAAAWLYRGAYSCALEVAKNVETSKHLRFFMSMINMLREFGINNDDMVLIT